MAIPSTSATCEACFDIGHTNEQVRKDILNYYLLQLKSIQSQGKSVLPLVCPVIPAEPVPDPDPGPVPDLDPGAGIHRSQGPNSLSIALHGNWIPVSQPE
jgi:hypothetical protein